MKKRKVDKTDWIVIGIVLAGLAFSGFSGWRALQPGGSGIVVPTPEVAAQPSVIPTLDLNASHTRQGPEIQPPAVIGRDNPFLKPQ